MVDVDCAEDEQAESDEEDWTESSRDSEEVCEGLGVGCLATGVWVGYWEDSLLKNINDLFPDIFSDTRLTLSKLNIDLPSIGCPLGVCGGEKSVRLRFMA